ncbi:hypothetical protein [Streptomyces echinatus]|uniref:hypothetical protein n=1 Tax=Streptomyces echinatus TaxID=67293 RepID=UPI003CD0C20B
MARRLDGALDVLDVEALFRGELHELRVLGLAESPVVVLVRLRVRAVGLDVVVHEVRTSSFIRGDRCIGPAGLIHYSSVA